MYLQQEYFDRHKIEYPLVLHNNESRAYLKRVDDNEIYLMFIKWNRWEVHPGCFTIQILNNARNENRIIDHLDTIYSSKCSWDKYEEEVFAAIDYLKEIGLKALPDNEKTISAWKMFSYGIKSVIIADRLFKEYSDKIYQDDLPVYERLSCIYECEEILRKKVDSLYQIWHYKFKNSYSVNSEWLVKLIND